MKVELRTVRALLRRLRQTAAVLIVFLFAPFAFAANLPADTPTQASSAMPARLVVGTLEGGWPPFEVIEDGHLTGLSGDYLRALVGPDVVIETRAYPDMPRLLAALTSGKVDLSMSMARTPEREHSLSFTAPYFRASTSVVVKADDKTVQGAAQLASARIAVERGFAMDRLLRERFPHARIMAFADTASALRAVANGDADAYLGFTPSVQYALANDEFRGLRIGFENSGTPSELRFAVPRSRAGLRDQLDRAMAATRPAEASAILTRGFDANFDPPSVYAAPRMVPTPAGQAQLHSLPPVAAHADRAGPPFNLRDDDSLPGGNAAGHGMWSVTAVRLLPLLIGIGVVLAVTLRAYLLLQREVRLRKRTERELAAQLNFQQTMMETVPYPLVAKDLDGRYIAINRAYEESSGLRREEVLGRTNRDVQAWGLLNSRKLESATHEMVRTGERSQLELEFADRNGEMRIGLFWTNLCRGVDGEPSCVLGTVVDITDIRRAEMLARENERRLFDVTRSLPAVVFQLRRDVHGHYSFPYIGGNKQHLLGGVGGTSTNPGEIDFEHIWEDDRSRVRAELERSARFETPIHMEFRSEGGDGLRWVRAELVPCREPTGCVVWSGYWVDASAEHAHAEELALARDLAEAASRAKDDFLAMMSHEIRTPMNGVLGLVEVLERTHLNADQGEMLGMIHESAGALLQILDDLLDYSKIEAGRLTLEAEPIDMRDLVDNAVGLLAGRAHEKGLKVRVDIAPEVAASLRGDSVRLRQILFNLLGNAIKFTLTGEVDVRVAVADRAQQSQTLEMSVEDTGIGIEPEVQARLFEPFVQAESSTTRRFGGTGLGLTICRKLIALMDGTLHLQSTPGVGTRMTVRLTMPIEEQRYKVSGLRGKRGIVAISDTRVAQALVHFGRALGIELRRVGQGAAELSDPAALADADLVFLGEEFEVPAAVRSGSRVVCLTEKPKPTGYRILNDAVRVSVNPISWRGLGAACAAALTGLSAPAPRAQGAEGAIAPPDRERAIASGRLILVAEDHPVNQELIRHQLALLGFACDVVNDGVEALTALQQTCYGCLITDCHMPNLSGYELARRVRETEKTNGGGTPRLPILGITANTAPEDLSQCRDAGMDDCLVKPTRLATLREHLGRWFGADMARPVTPVEPVNTEPAAEAVGYEATEAFVPVDLDHLTQLWGSESTVKALLDSFVTSVRDDVCALPPLLEDATVAQLRQWHHRVAGAAAVLQYPPLIAALELYRSGFGKRPPELLRADGAVLVRQCHAMLDGIGAQAAMLA